MKTHQIRLQGPWDVIPPEGDSLQPIRVPVSWRTLFGMKGGTATFLRRFNSPSNLTPQDRLFIHFPEGCGTIVECQLNGTGLSGQSNQHLSFEVTSALQLNNELRAVISYQPTRSEDQVGGLWQPVILEIISEE